MARKFERCQEPAARMIVQGAWDRVMVAWPEARPTPNYVNVPA